MKILFAGLLIAGSAFCDAVTDWNIIMRTAVRSQGAHIQSRFAAITHLAMFDAVNSITKEYRPYLSHFEAAPDASAEAAAITAAHRVLVTLVPGSASALDLERSRTLAAIPNGPGKDAGIAVGEAAAAAMISHRANDGSGTQGTYTPPIGPGYWQLTPPTFASAVGANWGKVRPFGLQSGDQFRSVPPPALTSREYSRDFREIKEVGNIQSAFRTEDSTNFARYISLTSPTQLWNDVAVQLSTAHRLTLAENARAFALMNMAVADSAIAVFEAKYFYNYWRPITAIRAGDTDGNPGTEPDAGFTSLIVAPAYPSYPSGWGALSNAARPVLEHLFGKRRQPLTLASNPSVPSVNLQYARLRHLTDDIDDARVNGGIHFRFEQDEAEVLGERVARYVLEHQLQRR